VSAPDNELSHEPVAVLGAGSWGTALAIQFARAGHPTRLWSRSAADIAAMRAERCNRRYLPDAPFPPDVELHDDDQFLELGVIDSLGFVELVEEVQARYGIAVDALEITEENFGSIDALVAFVERRRGT